MAELEIKESDILREIFATVFDVLGAIKKNSNLPSCNIPARNGTLEFFSTNISPKISLSLLKIL
jgi:hypothetical protein